jgi:hypothetical protein
MLNDFVEQSASINPGAIKMNRNDFGYFIRAFSKPSYLPISDKPYVVHIPTKYGVIPIFPSDKIPSGEIIIEPRVDIDEEFEKVILS